MRAINHALTGAVIGLSVDNPALAMPAALVSHLVCDAIPHHGYSDKNAISSKRFKYELVLDGLACVILVLILAIVQPKNCLVACLCAFLATSPDLLWVKHYKLALAGKKWQQNRLEKFLADIQWFEKPSGIYVEAVWFMVFSYIIWHLCQ